ncbi:MAG: hypothetical protein LBT44_08520 [Clostridiales bacterium]|nr:hypothetical protein [Clostridiales bacterium]
MKMNCRKNLHFSILPVWPQSVPNIDRIMIVQSTWSKAE